MAVEKLLAASRRPSAASGCACWRASSRGIGDHLTRCGAACLELQAMTPFLYGIEARELNWDLQEMLCGARVTSNYIRIGGVKHDMPPSFPRAAREIDRRRSARCSRDFDAVVTQNRIFVDRLKGTGMLSKEDCIRYAVTGPVLRAAGVPLDVRKDEPYLVVRRASTSTCRSARSATTTTATWCASRRCTRACASSSSAW